MQPHWLRIRQLPILRGGIIRCQKSGENNGQMQQSHNPEQDPCTSPAHQPSASVRILGSHASSMTSATRFPPIINSADNMAPPTTTNRSRDSVASRISGPRPGHPVITSTNKDPLSSAATENP